MWRAPGSGPKKAWRCTVLARRRPRTHRRRRRRICVRRCIPTTGISRSTFMTWRTQQDSFMAAICVVAPDGSVIWLSGRGSVAARGGTARPTAVSVTDGHHRAQGGRGAHPVPDAGKCRIAPKNLPVRWIQAIVRPDRPQRRHDRGIRDAIQPAPGMDSPPPMTFWSIRAGRAPRSPSSCASSLPFRRDRTPLAGAYRTP